MKKTLAIFDLDGTLVNSAKLVASILNELRIEMGKDGKADDFYTPWISLGGEDLVAHGLEIEAHQAKSYLEEFRNRYAALTTPPDTVYPGVFELLNDLSQRNVKISICTNKPRNLAEKVIRETGLAKFIVYMCAGGDLETKKPHPDNLAVCLSYFNESPKNSILIGDSSTDQKIAMSLGVDFAFYELGNNDGVDKSNLQYSFVNHLEIKKLFN